MAEWGLVKLYFITQWTQVVIISISSVLCVIINIWYVTTYIFLFHEDPFKKPGWVANFKSDRDVPWLKAAAAIIATISPKAAFKFERIVFRSLPLKHPCHWYWDRSRCVLPSNLDDETGEGMVIMVISPWFSWVTTMISVEAFDRQFGISSSWEPASLPVDLRHISQTVYELLFEIFWIFNLLLIRIQWPHQVKIWLMSRQLNCREMCRFVAWRDKHFHTKVIHILPHWLWIHKLFVKSFPDTSTKVGKGSNRHKKPWTRKRIHSVNHHVSGVSFTNGLFDVINNK